MNAVLAYERGLLSFMGSSSRILDMQRLLGISISASANRAEVVEIPEVSLKWTSAQASEVCDVVLFYKLADAIALVSNIAPQQKKFGPLQPLTGPVPRAAQQVMERLRDFGSLIENFKKAANDQVLPPEGEVNAPPSIRLFKALHKVHSDKAIMKVQHNFLLAAAHVAYMKEAATSRLTSTTHVVPDVPFGNFEHPVDSALLTPDEATFMESLKSMHGATHLRFGLQLAAFLTPLVLLLSAALDKKLFDRNYLVNMALALGDDKPPAIIDLEIRLWKALFSMVDDPSSWRNIMKSLAQELPSKDSLPPEALLWFRRRLLILEEAAVSSTHPALPSATGTGAIPSGSPSPPASLPPHTSAAVSSTHPALPSATGTDAIPFKSPSPPTSLPPHTSAHIPTPSGPVLHPQGAELHSNIVLAAPHPTPPTSNSSTSPVSQGEGVASQLPTLGKPASSLEPAPSSPLSSLDSDDEQELPRTGRGEHEAGHEQERGSLDTEHEIEGVAPRLADHDKPDPSLEADPPSPLSSLHSDDEQEQQAEEGERQDRQPGSEEQQPHSDDEQEQHAEEGEREGWQPGLEEQEHGQESEGGANFEPNDEHALANMDDGAKDEEGCPDGQQQGKPEDPQRCSTDPEDEPDDSEPEVNQDDGEDVVMGPEVNQDDGEDVVMGEVEHLTESETDDEGEADIVMGDANEGGQKAGSEDGLRRSKRDKKPKKSSPAPAGNPAPKPKRKQKPKSTLSNVKAPIPPLPPPPPEAVVPSTSGCETDRRPIVAPGEKTGFAVSPLPPTRGIAVELSNSLPRRPSSPLLPRLRRFFLSKKIC